MFGKFWLTPLFLNVAFLHQLLERLVQKMISSNVQGFKGLRDMILFGNYEIKDQSPLGSPMGGFDKEFY